MGVFEFIIAMVVIGSVTRIMHQAIASRAARERQMSTGQYQALCERLDKLERRMANLETIVLEAEKRKNFDQLL